MWFIFRREYNVSFFNDLTTKPQSSIFKINIYLNLSNDDILWYFTKLPYKSVSFFLNYTLRIFVQFKRFYVNQMLTEDVFIPHTPTSSVHP